MAGEMIVVLSDLHLGAGRFHAGNRLEDFTSDGAFAELLASLARESRDAARDVDLVLNGDFVEFLQVPAAAQFEPAREYAAADYRDMGPSGSAQRLRHVVAGHPAVFAALRDWLCAQAPRRRVVVLRGNHDPHWYWASVQDILRDAIGAQGAQRTLTLFPPLGYQVRGVYIEHGNQLAEAANRFQNMAEPLARGDPSQLETPWGSRFVIEFLNTVERGRYWVDGVTPHAALLWYALAYDPAFAVRALATLLRVAPRLVGVRDEIRDAWLTNVQSDPALAAQRYRDSAAYRAELHGLMAHALRELEPGLQVEVASDAPHSADPLRLGARMQEEQDRRLIDGATRLADEHGAHLVLLGHTHRALDMELRTGARYLNTGCWVWQMDLAGANESQWRALFARPDAFASMRRLTYARVDFDDAGAATATLATYQPAQPVDPAPRGAGVWERLRLWLRRRLARQRS